MKTFKALLLKNILKLALYYQNLTRNAVLSLSNTSSQFVVAMDLPAHYLVKLFNANSDRESDGREMIFALPKDVNKRLTLFLSVRYLNTAELCNQVSVVVPVGTEECPVEMAQKQHIWANLNVGHLSPIVT